MRKIIFLVSFIILVSCAKNSDTSNEKSAIEDAFSVKEYSTTSLVREKFLEFYDLKLLLENNPEFKKSIESRLANFKLDTIEVLHLNKNSKIQNLEIKELSLKVKSSEIKLKLLFEVEEKSHLKKDSILAIFIRDTIIINDEKIISTKIKFSRFSAFEN